MSTAITTNPMAPPRPAVARKKGLIPPGFKPYLAPVLVSVILLVGEVYYGILQSYWHTGLAIVVSILFEMLLGRWVTGRWPHPASAYITGISIGMILRSEYLWPYILC